MHPLASQTLHYLNDSLGVPTSGDHAWSGRRTLPYYLRDHFELRELAILGTPVLLAVNRHPGGLSPADIRTWLGKIHSLAGKPAIYVTESMASYERKRLIEQKVPFIVPGNQLYLPDLGLDLREYFRQRRAAPQSALSPSAQALLIKALLRPHWEEVWHPSEAAGDLGYTAMTISRAVAELVAAELAEVRKAGRSRHLVMNRSARETWELALPLLRSPVQRIVWTEAPIPISAGFRVAGLSALAKLSMLNEPRNAVVAVGRSAWQALRPLPQPLPEATAEARQIQLWNYSPALQPATDTVDPLSLILSLQDSTDDRVLTALDEAKEQLPW